jgi:hypothetical protein
VRLVSGIWGQRHNETVDFYGTPNETEESFNNNLVKMPNDWVYRTKKVTYQSNRLGHRSCDPDLLTDDYLLFGGCSHSEGVGLAIEDTYPSVVSKKLDRDYYNISIGGTGPDLLCHNIIMFITMLKVKPSCVIIQWPEIERFITAEIVNHELRGILHNTTMVDRDPILNFSLEHRIFSNLNLYYKAFLKEFLRNQNIPFIEVQGLYSQRVDYARDLAHLGIQSNLKAAEAVVNYINRTLKI